MSVFLTFPDSGIPDKGSLTVVMKVSNHIEQQSENMIGTAALHCYLMLTYFLFNVRFFRNVTLKGHG